MKRRCLVMKLSLPVLSYRCICVEGLVYSQKSKRNQNSGLGAVFLDNQFAYRCTSVMLDHRRRQNNISIGPS